MEQTNDERKYCVYRHVFPNGKCYIGITSQKLKRRWRNNGEGYKITKKNGEYYQPLMARAINKYGWENVKHEILFDGLNLEEASRIEQICILLFRSTDIRFGYNLTSGGEHYVPNKVTREKLSQVLKGRRLKPDCLKPVICIELNKIWDGIVDASKETNIMHQLISHACSGKCKTIGGYHWIYVEDFSIENIKRKLMKKDDDRQVSVVCIETGNVYEKILDATNDMDINFVSISRCLSGKCKTAGGYHWRKATEEERDCNRSKWADKIISKLLSNKELMDKIEEYQSKYQLKEIEVA